MAEIPDGAVVSRRRRAARAVHHLLVLAVPVLALWLAAFDLRHVLAKAKPPGALRLGHDLAAGGLGLAALVACAAFWARGRWRSTSLAPLRAAFVLFAAATGIHLAFFQPYVYDGWARVFLPAAAAACLLVPLVARLAERPWPRAARAADFAVFQLCLLPFLLEAALRVAPHVSDAPLFDFHTLSAHDRVERNTWAPGTPRFGVPLNRDGNYDTDRALGTVEGPLVVTIGDSFSQGVVPYPYHYTTVAEGILDEAFPGVEIYNVGVGAIGPPEYELLMREQALPLEPDWIVVALFLGNDSEIHVEHHGRAAALAPWFTRRQLRTTMVLKRLQALRRERAARGADAPARKRRVRPYPSAEAMVADMPWLADPLLEEPTFSEASFLRIEKLRVLQCCRPGRSDLGPLLEWLGRLVQTAGDAPLAFLLIPDEFQVEDGLWERLKRVPPAVPAARLDRDWIQTRVRAWLDERGLPYLDLLPELRAVEPLAAGTGRKHLYKLRDTHFNVRGNAAAGRAYAAFLAELLAGGSAGGVR